MRRLGVVLAAALAASALCGGAAGAPSTGTLRVLVVPVTWGPQPYSTRALEDAILGRAADWLHRASFGRLTVTGTVLPWQQALDASVTCTDRERIGDRALAAARAAHVDPAGYADMIFVVPPSAHQGCRENGYGSFDSNQVWLYGAIDLVTVVHELGHTFGLEHGNSWECAGGCAGVEYGDPYTVMGHGDGLFDAYDLAQLGWLDPPAQARNGTFDLGPIETRGPEPRALVIPTAHNEYWVDHREPVGLDDSYQPELARGVAVHAEPNRTNPIAPLRYGSFPDVLLPIGSGDSRWLLAPGRSFTVPGVFRLETLAAGGGHATVRFRWLDRTPPSAPQLDPVPRAVPCRSRGFDLTWSRSSDSGSGVAGYDVTSGGRRLARVADDFRFAPGVHVSLRRSVAVAVTAVDHAGNRSRPSVVRVSCR